MPARARSTTGWSSSSAARPICSRRWPRAGRSRTTAWSTPSTCARASSSTPPTASRRRATSTPTTWSSRFERQWQTGPSLPQRVGRLLRVLRRASACPSCCRRSRRSTTRPSSSCSSEPEAPFIAMLGDGLRLDPVGRVRRQAMQDAGTPEQVDLEPVGTGPFQLVAYQKDAVIRYKAQPRLLGRQGAARRSGVRDHARRLGPLAEAAGRRVPRHALPEPGRSGGDRAPIRTSTCSSRRA